MYICAQSVVDTKYGCSEKIDCNAGVRQRCPLSPTLFSLFVSDIMDCLREKTEGLPLSQVALHGWIDVCGWCGISGRDPKEVTRYVQWIVNTLQRVENRIEQTKIVVFGSSTDQWNAFQCYYHGQPIEITGCLDTWASPSRAVMALHKVWPSYH